MEKHWERCEAPICRGDETKGWRENVTWYPGEEICHFSPSEKFQKKQRKINRYVKLGKFRHGEEYFTASLLEKKNKITWATRGCKA